jgi:hypothetical protein
MLLLQSPKNLLIEWKYLDPQALTTSAKLTQQAPATFHSIPTTPFVEQVLKADISQR